MELDKFYTKKETAKKCIEIANIEEYDCIVEPSAGNGSFSSQINNCISYDIAPESENIIQQDYLLLKNNFQKNTLVIGNPPFGKRSSLAKDFIKQSIKLGARTIAFILPDTFDKITNQKVFPKNWHLKNKIKLEGTHFTADGIDYYVPCSFYIWTTDNIETDLREIEYPQSDLFIFLTRGDQKADFSINGNNGKVKDLKEITNSKSEHYIYIKDRNKINEIRDFFNSANYDFKSSVNGNNAWIGQQEILKYFYLNYKNNK